MRQRPQSSAFVSVILHARRDEFAYADQAQVRPCVIIDNDVAHRVRDGLLGHEFDYVDLQRGLWLRQGPCKKAVVSYGGQNADELMGDGDTRRWLIRLDEIGAARQASYAEVAEQTVMLRASGIGTSNDQHVIALAQAHGARVLCTRDAALMNDFRNRQILEPRGRIYASRNHNNMIRANCGDW